MAVQEQAAPRVGGGAASTIRRREASLWGDAWRRLIKNKAAVTGGIIILLLIFIATFADTTVFTWFTGAEPQPLLAPKPYDKQKLVDNNVVPYWLTVVFPTMIPVGEPGGYAKISDEYPFGADYVGRDILSRIIFGARISLAVAFVGPLIAMTIGVAYGLVAGYFGGKVDNLMMRRSGDRPAGPARGKPRRRRRRQSLPRHGCVAGLRLPRHRGAPRALGAVDGQRLPAAVRAAAHAQ